MLIIMIWLYLVSK